MRKFQLNQIGDISKSPLTFEFHDKDGSCTHHINIFIPRSSNIHPPLWPPSTRTHIIQHK